MSVLVLDAQDVIEKVPYEWQARILSDTYFSDIPIVIADEGNVAATVAEQQAVVTSKTNKVGVAVIILQPIEDDEENNLQFGPMTIRGTAQVIENRELNLGPNGTKKSARKVARRIRDVMKSFAAPGLHTTIVIDKPGIEPIQPDKSMPQSTVMYHVNWSCMELLQSSPTQVQAPQIVSLGGTFQITCATAGAKIIYVTDDSYPWSGNRKAATYSNPGAIPQTGVTIRACAYLDPLIPSIVQRTTLLS